MSIGQANVELGSTLNNGSALKSGHVMGDLSAVRSVMHHQQFQVLNIRHNNFLESVWQNMSSLLVSSVSNVGHDDSASLELSTDAGINTLWTTPALRNCDLSITLMALEAIVLALVHILDLFEWLHHCELFRR